MADRFRAYATIRVDRPVDPSKPKGEWAETDASGDVAFSGKVPADGIVKFDAGETKIRRVAFYKGAVAEEVCLGSVEVNASGKVAVSLADIPTD